MSNEEMAKKIFNGLGFIAFLLWLIFMLLALQWITDSQNAFGFISRFALFLVAQFFIVRNLEFAKELK